MELMFMPFAFFVGKMLLNGSEWFPENSNDPSNYYSEFPWLEHAGSFLFKTLAPGGVPVASKELLMVVLGENCQQSAKV